MDYKPVTDIDLTQGPDIQDLSEKSRIIKLPPEWTEADTVCSA